MDVLSRLLGSLRLSGSAGEANRLQAPWILPLRIDADFVRAHIVLKGSARLEQTEIGSVIIGEGELFVLPRSSTDAVLRSVEAGETIILSADFRVESPFAENLFSALDHFLHIKPDDSGVGPIVGLLCRESQTRNPGWSLSVDEGLKMLFVQILRTGMREKNPERCSGLLRALFDPAIARALDAIHESPGRNWTVAALAVIAGMSRAAFAERFSELAGTSPIAYLTKWRMSLAVDLLEQDHLTLERIAEETGYGSESAFNTAFQREMGQSPGAYRKGKRLAS